MTSDDYCPYAILGVSSDASPSEVEQAYRKKALETHPDKQQQQSKDGGISGSNDDEMNKTEQEREFAKVSESYQLLRDPERRKEIDAMRREGIDTKSKFGASSVLYTSEPKTETDVAAVHQLRVGDDETKFPEASPEAEELQRAYYSCPTTKATSTVVEGLTRGKYPDGKFTFRRVVIDPDNLNSRTFQDPYDTFREVFEGKGTSNAGKDDDDDDDDKGDGGDAGDNDSGEKNKAAAATKRKTSPTVPGDIDDKGRYNPVQKMSSRTKTICHPDGSQEVVMETIVTRKDGSVETKSESLWEEVVDDDDDGGEQSVNDEMNDQDDEAISRGVSEIAVAN